MWDIWDHAFLVFVFFRVEIYDAEFATWFFLCQIIDFVTKIHLCPTKIPSLSGVARIKFMEVNKGSNILYGGQYLYVYEGVYVYYIETGVGRYCVWFIYFFVSTYV